MGTPDMLGTYGIFTLFSSRPEVFERQDVSGGIIQPIDVIDGVARGAHRRTAESVSGHAGAGEGRVRGARRSDANVGEDRRRRGVAGAAHRRMGRVAADRAAAGATHQRARRGPLPSEAARAAFRALRQPDQPRPATRRRCRFSSPEGYAAELADRAGGRFYTQGMPEDTRGMNAGVLSADELLAQARLTADENLRQFDYVLGGFADGLLFYYFGHIDQVSHMMWRAMDPTHPAYTEADAKYRACGRGPLRPDGRRRRPHRRRPRPERPAGGDVGSRLRPVAPRDEPEQLAPRLGLPGRHQRQGGGVAWPGRRGLVAHAGLCGRAEWPLRQHPGSRRSTASCPQPNAKPSPPRLPPSSRRRSIRRRANPP